MYTEATACWMTVPQTAKGNVELLLCDVKAKEKQVSQNIL